MHSPEELIRRLKPMLGAKADDFWHTYLASDPEERALLHQTLEHLHTHWVDDYRQEQIVLTPPSTLEQLLGTYPAGIVWYAGKPLYPFSFLEKELVQHIGVFGRTGAGKSSFVKSLLTRIMPRRATIILDWKGTYTDLCSGNVLFFVPGSTVFPFTFNPLDVRGMAEEEQNSYLRQVVELFLECYLDDLKLLTVHGVESLLLASIQSLHIKDTALTFAAIYHWLQGFKGSFRETDWRITALNLLSKMLTGPLGKVMVASAWTINWLATNRAIIELGNTGSEKDRAFLIRTLILRLYYHFQNQGPADHMRLFLVIEEAHNILLKRGGRENIIERVLRQIREFGVGICIVDQHPALISLPALGTYCTVAFNLRLRQDRAAMASALSLEQTDYLGRLPSRFAIVKIQDRFLTPFLIKSYDLRLDPRPSVEEIRNRMATMISAQSVESGQIRVVRKVEDVVRGFSEVVSPENEVVRVIRKVSNREGKRLFWEEVLLVHICQEPMLGAVKRYCKLGLNRYQGNKHRASLLENGLVISKPQTTRSGRIMLLVPTGQGFAWLSKRGITTASDKEGGMQHCYLKNRLASWFKHEGYSVALEVDLGGNRAIDLVVSQGKQRVPVEIETGKNTDEQILKNITKSVAYADAVISFILSPAKAEKIRQQINDGRVTVVEDYKACVSAVLAQMWGDVM